MIFELIWRFFLTGLLAVGGGLATLPFIYEMGTLTGWFSDADVLNMIAVSESTPGPLGINMATFVGATVTHAAYGGVIATLAIVAPSFICILIVARVLDRFKTSPLTQSVFSALRPASTGLVAAAALSVMIKVLFNFEDGFSFAALLSLSTYNFIAIAIAAAAFVLIRITKKSPVWFIIGGAILGIVLKL